MENYYEQNPALFKAMNLLKSSSIVYEQYSPQEYRTLCDMREEANRILSFDGCRMDINVDFRAAYIRFLPNDEYQNLLRARFSADDMKVYVCLLYVYEQRFSIEGRFVRLDIPELQGLMLQSGFSLGAGPRKTVTKAALKGHLKKFARYGIIRLYGSDEMTVNPGVVTCISRREFNDVYDAVIKPWTIGEASPDEDVDDPAEEREENGTEGPEDIEE